MKILSTFSIIIFCLVIGKFNKKSFKNSLFISIAAILTPVFISKKIDIQTFFIFFFSFVFLFLFDLVKNKFIKKILFLSILIYFCLAILYLSGILNHQLEIDFEKLFFMDNSSFEIIKRFQLNALYLPKSLRPLVFNYFQIFFVFFIRTLSYVWIDKIIIYLGFSFIYLLYLTIKKKNKVYLFFSIIVFLMGVLHRDPNNQLLFLFSIPTFLIFFIKNTDKINIYLLFLTTLISCLYSFL